jgi:hypothetical protein
MGMWWALVVPYVNESMHVYMLQGFWGGSPQQDLHLPFSCFLSMHFLNIASIIYVMTVW